MIASFYRDGHNLTIAQSIRDCVNSAENFLSIQTLNSTRATGDAIQNLISDNLEEMLGEWCTNYTGDFPRRSMADLAFTDVEGFRHFLDVKSHRHDTVFNMPNLTSVERIASFYGESDKNVFSLVMVKYAIDELRVVTDEVIFAPIESIDWDCLTIGALGWGQIQISNSNIININGRYSRKEWMLEFCERILAFYPKEISKIHDRISRFREVRTYWESHQGP